MPAKVIDLQERVTRRANSNRKQQVDNAELHLFNTCSWDIETSNLDADFGIILCSSIKPLGKETTTIRLDEGPTYADAPWDDKWLVKQIRDQLEEYMIVIGWNHVSFDLPFINSRLLKHGLKPIDTSTMCMVDMLWASRYRMRIHSNRLDSVIEYLGTTTQKSPLLGDLWCRAMAGDQSALDKIVEHNVRDVVALEEVSEKLSRFVKLQYRLVR